MIDITASTVAFYFTLLQFSFIFRCVPDNQRSYALGLQFLCMRSLSFIPGPVIFGAIIDGECTLWSKNACGKRGNCLEYKVDSLSISILIFGCVTASKYNFMIITQFAYVFRILSGKEAG